MYNANRKEMLRKNLFKKNKDAKNSGKRGKRLTSCLCINRQQKRYEINIIHFPTYKFCLPLKKAQVALF